MKGFGFPLSSESRSISLSTHNNNRDGMYGYDSSFAYFSTGWPSLSINKKELFPLIVQSAIGDGSCFFHSLAKCVGNLTNLSPLGTSLDYWRLAQINYNNADEIKKAFGTDSLINARREYIRILRNLISNYLSQPYQENGKPITRGRFNQIIWGYPDFHINVLKHYLYSKNQISLNIRNPELSWLNNSLIEDFCNSISDYRQVVITGKKASDAFEYFVSKCVDVEKTSKWEKELVSAYQQGKLDSFSEEHLMYDSPYAKDIYRKYIQSIYNVGYNGIHEEYRMSLFDFIDSPPRSSFPNRRVKDLLENKEKVKILLERNLLLLSEVEDSVGYETISRSETEELYRNIVEDSDVLYNYIFKPTGLRVTRENKEEILNTHLFSPIFGDTPYDVDIGSPLNYHVICFDILDQTPDTFLRNIKAKLENVSFFADHNLVEITARIFKVNIISTIISPRSLVPIARSGNNPSWPMVLIQNIDNLHFQPIFTIDENERVVGLLQRNHPITLAVMDTKLYQDNFSSHISPADRIPLLIDNR
jgi:hypothetical protein